MPNNKKYSKIIFEFHGNMQWNNYLIKEISDVMNKKYIAKPNA